MTKNIELAVENLLISVNLQQNKEQVELAGHQEGSVLDFTQKLSF